MARISGLLGYCLKVAVTAYKYAVSPLLPAACRFHPTCSEYAIDAIDGHGPFIGALYAVKRLLKCHPFDPGGFDPAPEAKTPERNEPSSLPR